MKIFFAVLISVTIFTSTSYADNFIKKIIQQKFGGYYCEIKPEAPYCVKKKHGREAFKYCYKIYPYTKKDRKEITEIYDKNYKCQCEYMSDKDHGNKSDCKTLTDTWLSMPKDVKNKK